MSKTAQGQIKTLTKKRKEKKKKPAARTELSLSGIKR